MDYAYESAIRSKESEIRKKRTEIEQYNTLISKIGIYIRQMKDCKNQIDIAQGNFKACIESDRTKDVEKNLKNDMSLITEVINALNNKVNAEIHNAINKNNADIKRITSDIAAIRKAAKENAGLPM